MTYRGRAHPTRDADGVEVIEVIEPGPSGPAGPGGPGSISADPDNRARLGSDNGFFVPDGVANFEAYYILAKT